MSFLLLFGCSSISSDTGEQASPSVPVSSTQASSEPSIKVSDIAGKNPLEVKKILGSPISKETVSPSGTPCPCDKNIYKDGEVEVVFMNEKADWITFNLPASKIDTSGLYLSVDQFDNPAYTYIKVATK